MIVNDYHQDIPDEYVLSESRKMFDFIKLVDRMKKPDKSESISNIIFQQLMLFHHNTSQHVEENMMFSRNVKQQNSFRHIIQLRFMPHIIIDHDIIIIILTDHLHQIQTINSNRDLT
jgi:hypothetical protein